MWPHIRQPTRLPHPWDSPGKNTGVGCHFLLQCMKVKSESEVTQSCLTLSDPMDCSPPGSSIHGIFQKEYWSGVPLPSARITIARRNINNFRYADDTTLMAKSEVTKEPFDEGERGEWKNWLKTQHSENEDGGIWFYHFMVNRWGKYGHWHISFSWALKSLRTVTTAMKFKDVCLEEKLWTT